MSEPERACDERALLFLAFRDGLDGNSLNLHRSFVGTVCGNNVQIVRGARLITVLSRDGRVHLPTHIELLAARDACFSKSLSGLHEGKCFGLETRFWKVALPFRLSVWLTAANRLFVSMALLEAQEMALISRVKLSATVLASRPNETGDVWELRDVFQGGRQQRGGLAGAQHSGRKTAGGEEPVTRTSGCNRQDFLSS